MNQKSEIDIYVESFIGYWNIRDFSVEKCMFGEERYMEEFLDVAPPESEGYLKVQAALKFLKDNWDEIEKLLLKKQAELRNAN